MAAPISIIVGGYVPEDIQRQIRTRDAVRRIRRLPLRKTQQKKLLAVWFQQHKGAALSEGAKRAAYIDLLGTDFYTKLRG